MIDFKKWGPIIGALSLFVFICVFFIWIHPIVVFDQDDWHYLANYRRPFPIWEAWNPGRVMPEIIMPFAGYLAAYFATPVLGDYVTAVTVTCALIVATAVVCYYHAFKKILTDIFGLEVLPAVFFGLFFILAHFGLFRSRDENNIYLFYADDLACYFFYLLPALLNAVLVLWCVAVRNFPDYFKRADNSKKGMIILLLYLAVFSNLFDSIILAAFCFVMLCSNIYKRNGNYKFYTTIICLWLVSMLFEANGHNAAHMAVKYSYFDLPIRETWLLFYGLARQIDWSYVILSAVCLLAAGVTYYKTKVRTAVDKQYKTVMQQCFAAFVLTLMYLILLCAKAGPHYADRIQSMYGIFFYGLMLISMSGAYILRKTAAAKQLFPLVLLAFLVTGSNVFSPFRESNTFNFPSRECMAVSRNFIDQAQVAEAQGQSEMILKVPKGRGDFNWPHPPQFFGDHIAHTLYSHGLIHHQIKMKVQIDPELNTEYYKQDKI